MLGRVEKLLVSIPFTILLTAACFVGSAFADETETLDMETMVANGSFATVYRLYNPYTPGGDHHYTINKVEHDNLVKAGWVSESSLSNIYQVYSSQATGTAPVYREYNPYASTGTHNWTTSKAEHDSLIEAGWRDEGVAWYSDTEAKHEYSVPVYRLYNPYTGEHFYCRSLAEYKNVILSGWNGESEKSTPSTTNASTAKGDKPCWYGIPQIISQPGYGVDTRPKFSKEDTAITLDREAFFYTGSAIVPKVTVTHKGKVLHEGTDYQCVFNSNVGYKDVASWGQVDVIGKGAYTGVVGKLFRIYASSFEVDDSEIAGKPLLTNDRAMLRSGSNEAFAATSSDENVVKVTDVGPGYCSLLAGNPGMATIHIKSESGRSLDLAVSVVLDHEGTLLTSSRLDTALPTPEITDCYRNPRGYIDVISDNAFSEGCAYDGIEMRVESQDYNRITFGETTTSPWNYKSYARLTSQAYSGLTWKVKLRTYAANTETGEMRYSNWVTKTVEVPSDEKARAGKPAYSYEMYVYGIDDIPLIEGNMRVLYIRTDNPDPSTILLTEGSGKAASYLISKWGGDQYYADIDYAYEYDEDWPLKKVDGGFIAYIAPEKGTVAYQVRECNKEGYVIAASQSFQVKSAALAARDWEQEVLAACTTDDMDPFEKMSAVSGYLCYGESSDTKFRYLVNTKGTLIDLAQMPNSPFWLTLRWDSYVSPSILCQFAELIGGFDDIHNCYNDYSRYEPEWTGTHFLCRVTIGDDVRYYQACPLTYTGNVESYSMIDFSDLGSIGHFAPGAVRTLR